MNNELYIRTELNIIEFDTEDVIMTSSLIEEDPGEHGGGVIGDP